MKTLLSSLIWMLCTLSLSSQTVIQQPNYWKVNEGVYKTKNLLPLSNAKKIPRQTIYDAEEDTKLIFVGNQPIALFDRINEKGNHSAIGTLHRTSFIEVDTTFYHKIYQEKEEKWKVSFNVWSAIKINGKKYYTDYQIHDFIAYEKHLKKLKQKILVIAKSTGYDYYIDLGFPNNFLIVILDENDAILFESKVLDFDFADEFWGLPIEELISKENEYTFSINGLKEKLVLNWNGTVLKANVE